MYFQYRRLKIVRQHDELMGKALNPSPPEHVAFALIGVGLKPVKLPVVPEITPNNGVTAFRDFLDIGSEVGSLYRTDPVKREKLAEGPASVRIAHPLVYPVDRDEI